MKITDSTWYNIVMVVVTMVMIMVMMIMAANYLRWPVMAVTVTWLSLYKPLISPHGGEGRIEPNKARVGVPAGLRAHAHARGACCCGGGESPNGLISTAKNECGAMRHCQLSF